MIRSINNSGNLITGEEDGWGSGKEFAEGDRYI